MQKQGSDKLEELLKSRLDNAEQAAPESLWTALEEELFPEKKRRFLFWWWLLIGELLAIGAIVPVKLNRADESAVGIANTQQGNACSNSDTVDSASSHAHYNQSDTAGIYRLLGERRTAFVTHMRENQVESVDSDAAGNPAGPKTTRHENNSAVPFQNRKGIRNERTDIPANREVQVNFPEASQPEPVTVSNGNSMELSNEPAESNTRLQAFSDSTRLAKKVDTLPLKNPDAPAGLLISRATVQNPVADNAPGPWRIGLAGGYDFFSQDVFASYLQTGQLSRNAFHSQGYELSGSVSRNFLPWLSVEAFGAFNRKKSGYVYDILVDRDAYFSKVMNNESLTLEDVSASSSGNCYYLRNAMASYTLESWLGGLNIGLEKQFGKNFGIYAGFGGLGNFSSLMHKVHTEKLVIQQPAKEHLSYLQAQAFLGFSRRFSDNLAWRVSAAYRTQLASRSEFLSNQHGILLSTGISVLLNRRK